MALPRMLKKTGQAIAADRLAGGQFLTSLSRGVAAGDEKQNSADDGDTAHDGPDGHSVLVFLVNLKGAEFRDVLLGGEAGKPAVRENNDSHDDENESQNAGWFHPLKGSPTLN